MMEDKRITYAAVCGRTFPLCMTVAVHQKIIEKFGGLAEMAEQLDGEASTAQCAWLTHTLIEGGIAREKAMAWMMDTTVSHEDVAPPMEVLMDAMDLADVTALWPVLFKAIRRSRGMTVETDPAEETEEKNGETTQG